MVQKLISEYSKVDNAIINRSLDSRDYWDLEDTEEIVRASSPDREKKNRRTTRQKPPSELLRNMQFSDGELILQNLGQ